MEARAAAQRYDPVRMAIIAMNERCRPLVLEKWELLSVGPGCERILGGDASVCKICLVVVFCDTSVSCVWLCLKNKTKKNHGNISRNILFSYLDVPRMQDFDIVGHHWTPTKINVVVSYLGISPKTIFISERF